MTVLRSRPLALALAAGCAFSFAAQRIGFTPGLRLVWLASGVLSAAAFFALSFIKKGSAGQTRTGLALLCVSLFVSFASAALFFSLRVEPARELAGVGAILVSGKVTGVSEN